MGLGVGGGKGEQPGALLGQGGAVVLSERFEGLDEQGCGPALPLDLPCSADEAGDEHGGLADEEERLAVLVGNDAGAVGVAEERVVVVGRKRGGAGLSGWGRGASSR